MTGAPMTYRQLREQARAVGIPPHEFVQGRKSAGNLIERRPPIEPGLGARRQSVFLAVAPKQLQDDGQPQADATPYIAPCGRVRIGPEDL